MQTKLGQFKSLLLVNGRDINLWEKHAKKFGSALILSLITNCEEESKKFYLKCLSTVI